MNKVPNLLGLRSTKQSEYLYQIYLIRLRQCSRWHRIVEACRQIRAYALQRGQPRMAEFTYDFEIDALSQLGRYSVAWRQLRRLERIAYGRNIKLNAEKWRSYELNWFIRYHSPLLYFLGRYRLARQLIEATLAKMFRPSRTNVSYELLRYIYNSVRKPQQRQHVTLFHIYAAMGKSLVEWPGWTRFVEGLHPKLFTLAGVQKRDLIHQPELLRSLHDGIEAELKRRLTAGVSDGQRDLTDTASKVKRRQEAVLKKTAPLQRTASEHQKQLESIFPELKALTEK